MYLFRTFHVHEILGPVGSGSFHSAWRLRCIRMQHVSILGFLFTAECYSTGRRDHVWIFHSLCDRHLSCSYVLARLWILLLCTFVYKDWFEYVFSVLWGVFQFLWLAGSHGNPAPFEQPADFSTAAASLYIPISNVWGFQFLHILTHPYLPLLDYSYPIECEVVSCGLDGHFPCNWHYLFKSLLAICVPPLEMCLFKSCPIVIAMFVLSLLSSKSPLYILDSGPYPDTWVAVFSPILLVFFSLSW